MERIFATMRASSTALCVHLMASLIAYLSSRDKGLKRDPRSSALLGTSTERNGANKDRRNARICALEFRQSLRIIMAQEKALSEEEKRIINLLIKVNNGKMISLSISTSRGDTTISLANLNDTKKELSTIVKRHKMLKQIIIPN